MSETTVVGWHRDIDQLMKDIHEAHYHHSFKFSSEGGRLFAELKKSFGGTHPDHTPEVGERLRKEYLARGTSMRASDVHGGMFNDRIATLIREGKAFNARAAAA
jgi:hypothetical protein